MRERVAVVGAGVSGLTAAYLLQRRYDVTLFEAEGRLGGHAHTHELDTVAVDSGFIVHNDVTYPNLLRLFAELGVATQDSEMSMSVRDEATGLEYAGARGLQGLFAQPRNLANPRYLRMLGEVLRFHRQARAVVDGTSPLAEDVTFGEFLDAGGYSPYFVETFAVPVVSAVWSSGPELSRQYPARYLFTFLANHGMLSIGGSHRWRTVVGGSRTYVERAAKGLSAVEVSTPVRARGAQRATRCASATTPTSSAASTASSSPPTPRTRCACSSRRPPSRCRCSAPSATRATRPCCTPTPRCSRAPRGPGRRGTCCACRGSRRCWSATT